MKINKLLFAFLFIAPLGSCSIRKPIIEFKTTSYVNEPGSTIFLDCYFVSTADGFENKENYEFLLTNNTADMQISWTNEVTTFYDKYILLAATSEKEGSCDLAIKFNYKSNGSISSITTEKVHIDFKWLEKRIVEFYDNDGNLISSSSQYPNEPVYVPQIDNDEFLGWSDGDWIEKLDDIIYPTKSCSYYAVCGNDVGTDGLVYELDCGEYIVTGYKGIEYDVTIPAIYKGRYVTSIKEYAFKNKAIESIKLPQTISKIGIYAFQNCISLKKLDFENNILLTSLENGIFSGCSSLETICIPKFINKINESVFYNCNKLTILFKTESEKNISFSTGYGKNWNPSNRPYYFNISKLCENDICKYAIKNDNMILLLKYYGGKVFNETKINDLDIGYYGYGCFENSLIEEVTISSKAIELATGCFSGCSNLKKVVFEENSILEKINDFSFGNCSSLNSILLPSSLKSVEAKAFSGCSNITILFETHGKEGLSLSTSYNENWNPLNRPYYFDVTSEPITDITGKFSYIPFSDGKIGILKYLSDADSDTVNVGKIDGKTVKIILPSAFSGTKVSRIILSSEIEEIGKYAFLNCENLKEVDTSRCAKLSTIGDSAFSGCKRLNYFFVRNCIEKIGKDAFKNCSNLTILFNSLDKSEINLNGYNPSKQREIFNVKNVYEKYINVSGSLKYYVSNRNEVGIISYVGNNTTTDILGNVYENGPNTDMCFDYIDNMPVIEICDSAFYGLSDNANGKSIVNFTFGKHIKRIGKNAFCDLYSGTSRSFKIIFEDESNLETICDYAFCGNYESGVIIPKSVKKIGSYAFGRSTWLNSRTIFMEAIDKSGVELGSSWNGKQTVYWGTDWTYVNGVPTPTNS